MKIKFDGSQGPMQRYSDLIREWFYIGKYDWLAFNPEYMYIDDIPENV